MKKNKYLLLITIIVITLIIGLIILLMNIPNIKKDEGYKTVSQSKSTSTINYDFKSFKNKASKIGFDGVKCNDKDVEGMENIVCVAQSSNEDKKTFDSLSLTYNADTVETLILRLNYDKLDSKVIRKDIKSIINNLIVFNLEEKLIANLKSKLDFKNTVHGVTNSGQVGNYYAYYNLKEIEGEEKSFYLMSIAMYLKSTQVIE